MDSKKLLQRKPWDDQKRKKNGKRTMTSPRSPLQLLNVAAGSITSSSSSSSLGVGSSFSSTITTSSSLSTEAPIGRLRSLASGNVRKPRSLSSTTAKSVPSSKSALAHPSSFRSNRSLKENLPKQVKPNPFKRNSSVASKQKVSADLRVASVRKPDLLKVVKTDKESGIASTPAGIGKLASSGSSCQVGNKGVKLVEEDSTSTTSNTPPIQQSVSPEIPGGASISLNAASPACYATGHLLSGVTDRRKCRARGILTVGRYDPGCSTSNNTVDLHEFSSSSLVVEPLEASMRWLCFNEENGDQKDVSGLPSFSSPSSNQRIISNICNAGERNCNSSNSSMGQTRFPFLSVDHQVVEHLLLNDSSPATATHEVITTSKERRTKQYDLLPKGSSWSPLSIDSLGSENMIQTPESDSISNHGKGVSFHCLDSLGPQGDYHYPEIQSLEVLVRENSSPSPSPSPSPEETILPLAYDSSFQFPGPILSVNSIENSQQLPNAEENYGEIYCSSYQASVSLKDGLNLTSEITDTDDPDYCRCLSDDDSC